MEDLTFGYKQPSIIDIKMGTSSVGEEATPEKRAAMALKDKTTTTVSLGIRVVGARVSNAIFNIFFKFPSGLQNHAHRRSV
jgi:hypothetical protein